MTQPAEQLSSSGRLMTATLLEAARDEREARRRRRLLFGVDLLSDPSWDLLLDLFIASAEERGMSISSACIRAPAPAGTALRCIAHLVDVGLVSRTTDPDDARNLLLVPTNEAVAKLASFFADSERDKKKSAA
jgi:hypothetical protein